MLLFSPFNKFYGQSLNVFRKTNNLLFAISKCLISNALFYAFW